MIRNVKRSRQNGRVQLGRKVALQKTLIHFASSTEVSCRMYFWAALQNDFLFIILPACKKGNMPLQSLKLNKMSMSRAEALFS